MGYGELLPLGEYIALRYIAMGRMGFMGMIITPMLRMIPILPIFFFFLHSRVIR